MITYNLQKINQKVVTIERRGVGPLQRGLRVADRHVDGPRGHGAAPGGGTVGNGSQGVSDLLLRLNTTTASL